MLKSNALSHHLAERLGTVALLCSGIFVISCIYEVLVFNRLYVAQHFLIGSLLLVLSVWAMAEPLLLLREPNLPSIHLLVGLLALQFFVVLVRHSPELPLLELGLRKGGGAAGGDFGSSALFITAYSVLFLSIGLALLGRYSWVDRQRTSELQRQIALTEQAHATLRQTETRYRMDLERDIAKRTEELATARQEAEVANAVKTRFMANLGHEMRTPLQGILGFAELGRKRAGDEIQASRYFATILENGQRLSNLIESLLDLVGRAHLEHSGLMRDGWEHIQLRKFLMELVHLQSLRAEQSGKNLVFESVTSQSQIYGDTKRLRQVFDHLIGNALRYSGSGTTVTFRVADTRLPAFHPASSAPAISFMIIDQGCGIPESEIKAVFEPFYESTRTASGAGGTGLGLTLSRVIIHRHHGTISLSNREVGGLACEVILPVNQEKI